MLTNPRSSEDEPLLALIVGCARSGTTLLRALLDAHPEIGCPPEAGIPGLLRHVADVWSVDAALPSHVALARVRGVLEALKSQGPDKTL